MTQNSIHHPGKRKRPAQRAFIGILAGLSAAALIGTSVALEGANGAQTTSQSESLSKAEQSFAALGVIKIHDFVGEIEISQAASDQTKLRAIGPASDGAFALFQRSGDTLEVFDAIALTKTGGFAANWRRSHGAMRDLIKEQSKLVVAIAPGTKIELKNSAVLISAKDLNNDLYIADSFAEGQIGDLNNAHIGIVSSGDLALGNVANALAIKIKGSGNLSAKNVGALKADLYGSGSVRTGQIKQDADIGIYGSGDAEIGNVGGGADVSIHGSGDVTTGTVAKGAAMSIHGSGDVRIAKLSGMATAMIHGFGSAQINGGALSALDLDIHGFGDFSHKGSAKDPNISIHGSGDVHIGKVIGQLHSNGVGNIRVDAGDGADNLWN